MEIHSADEDKSKTPKSYVRFYGVAAMYKKVNVELNQPSAQEYYIGNEKINALPMQVELNSGAQIAGSKTRDFWTNPGTNDDKITVNYPEEFISYLNSKKGTKLSDEVNFTSDNVDNELKKTEKQNLYYIPYDKYFISWIESVQKNVAHDTYGYHQNLKITPKVSYADVTVEVLPSAGEGNGSFISSELVAGKVSTQ